MKSRSSFVCSALAALALAVGCQSAPMGESAMSKSSPPTKAVLVSSGQGSTILFIPQPDGSMAMLASGKMEKCAQCEADVASYFKTGKIDSKCAVCGATRAPLSGTN